MSSHRRAVRAVLDTNILVSHLVFADPRFAPLDDALETGKVVALLDDSTVAELIRVIGYPQFAGRAEPAALRCERFLALGERIAGAAPLHHRLPECRDPHDQKFLALADRGNADVLVSDDRSLLALARRVRFQIVTAEAFLAEYLDKLDRVEGPVCRAARSEDNG